jgi:hypothetical protein
MMTYYALVTRAMLRALTAAALLFYLQGCIPFAIGGYIGYQIARDNAHDNWCTQNVGDPSCHP